MGRRLVKGALFAALLMSAGSASGAARPLADYRSCDGYGAPNAKSDGMTAMATFFGIFNPPAYGNTDQAKTLADVTLVAACDRALADLPPQHWMRAVSLWRARAMHHLAGGDTAAALADLDRADGASQGQTDIYFRRSLGLGVDVVRAVAERRAGQAAAGQALKPLTARPYSLEIAISTIYALGNEADAPSTDTALRALARLDPASVDLLFTDAIGHGRFAEAVDLYPQLSPARELGDLWAPEEQARALDIRNAQSAAAFHASRTSAFAYALAATGHGEAARAALAQARSDLARDLPVPAPLDPNPKKANRLRDLALTGNSRVQAAADGAFAYWTDLVDLRLKLAAGDIKGVLAGLRTHPLPPDGIGAEFFDTLATKLPPADRRQLPDTTALKRDLPRRHETLPKASLDEIYKILPGPETILRVPPYREAKRPMLAMTGSISDLSQEGYRAPPSSIPGAVRLTFRGLQATRATVEEMALMRAAEMAREAGHKGFVIVDRMATEFTLQATQYGAVLRSDPDGYQVQLDIVFVDPDALPETYRHATWRVLDADTVFAALDPIYGPSSPAQIARAAKDK